MKNTRKEDYEDDNRVIADMSGIEPQPLLIPRFRKKESEDERSSRAAQESVQLDRGEKRALIGGALAAGLVVLGVLAAGFAIIIMIIGSMG